MITYGWPLHTSGKRTETHVLKTSTVCLLVSSKTAKTVLSLLPILKYEAQNQSHCLYLKQE